MTVHSPGVQAVLDEVAGADQLTLELAAAAWCEHAEVPGETRMDMAILGATRAAARGGFTDQVRQAQNTAHELAYTVGARSPGGWLAIRYAVSGAVLDSLGDYREIGGYRFRKGQVATLSEPWRHARNIRAALADAGRPVEALALALLLDGWRQPIDELPGVAAAVLAP